MLYSVLLGAIQLKGHTVRIGVTYMEYGQFICQDLANSVIPQIVMLHPLIPYMQLGFPYLLVSKHDPFNIGWFELSSVL